MKWNGSPIGKGSMAGIAFVLAGLMFGALASCNQWTEEQKKRQSLPDFQFEGLNDEPLTRAKLPEDAPVTIFYFDPDCSHCKETMEAILSKLDQFGKNTLVIVSSADRAQLITFLIEHGLMHRPGVMVGTCEPQEFLDTFGTTQTPTVLFYGGDWDLKRAFKGTMTVDHVMDGMKAALEE